MAGPPRIDPVGVPIGGSMRVGASSASYRVSPGSWPDFARIADSERLMNRSGRAAGACRSSDSCAVLVRGSISMAGLFSVWVPQDDGRRAGLAAVARGPITGRPAAAQAVNPPSRSVA
jgi:hypothetical protein